MRGARCPLCFWVTSHRRRLEPSRWISFPSVLSCHWPRGELHFATGLVPALFAFSSFSMLLTRQILRWHLRRKNTFNLESWRQHRKNGENLDFCLDGEKKRIKKFFSFCGIVKSNQRRPGKHKQKKTYHLLVFTSVLFRSHPSSLGSRASWSLT